MKKNIAIVCGGYSKEEVVSLKSAGQIAQVIDTEKFNAYTVLITRDSWVVKLDNTQVDIDKNDFSFLGGNKKVKFDAVLMAIHGAPGEDGKLQSYFEMLNIPLTTCNAFVSALTFNKYATKLYLKDAGVKMADSVFLRKKDAVDAGAIVEKLGLPMFVKPNNAGSSFGVNKVKKTGELMPAIEKAFIEDHEVLIEPFIGGGEFTCGVFKSKHENIVFPVTEIVSKTEFFDYEAKYEGMADEITPARLSAEKTARIQKKASEIYDLLNCNGIVRVDFLMEGNDFYFMEINTVPGMSQESIVPQQVRAHGMEVKEFYTKLIEDALDRP